MLSAVGQYALWTGAFGFFTVLAKQLDATSVLQSALITIHISLAMIGSFLTSWRRLRITPHQRVYAGFVLVGIGVAIAALAPSLKILLIARMFTGLGMGIGYPVLMGMSIVSVRDDERTIAMGLLQAIYAIGMFVGPAVSGAIADAIGLQPMFGITAFVTVALGIAGMRMTNYFIRNAHLDGDSFFWQAGKVGALLIHGYTACTAEVRPLGQYLHEHGYTVSGPLLPGHNTSPQDMNRKKWHDWTDTVDQAYAELKSKCDRVFVCGESMGALLTLYLAIHHPEIAGIVVYAPALRVANHDATMRQARLLYRFIPHIMKQDREPSAADARWRGYNVNPIPALVQMNHLQREIEKHLREIHQPLLILQGRRDKSIDVSSGEIILQRVSSTEKEMHWFEQSTHCVILDCEWEQAAEMTVRFFERARNHRQAETATR